MPGGRLQPMARAAREYAQAIAAGRAPSDDLFEDAVRAVEDGSLSRRDLLKRAGLVGGALAVTPWMRSRSVTPDRPLATGRTTPHDVRVAVVGAGLAGLTAAYRLAQQGVNVRLFEARDRMGGRCWTARGFADGQIAEHGGEFIDTRHVHLIQLAKELELHLDDLWKGYSGAWPVYVDGTAYRGKDLGGPRPARPRGHARGEAGRRHHARPQAERRRLLVPDGNARGAAHRPAEHARVDGRARPRPVGHAVGEWLNESMCGWYGLDMDRLSAILWFDYFLIPSPGGDERWHVRGGNDRVTDGVVDRLPARRRAAPRRRSRRSGGGTTAATSFGSAESRTRRSSTS